MTYDPTFAAAAAEAASAIPRLVEAARGQGWMYPAELRARSRRDQSGAAMGIALDALIDDGVFEVDDQLRVRLVLPEPRLR